MHKESSLITISSTIKKLAVILFIIAILLICWNTFRKFPKNNSVTPVTDKEYTYLPQKNLTADFKPQPVKSLNEISLYTKEILLNGEFPKFPKYVLMYKATIPKENFGTFAYADKIATNFGFTEQQRVFEANQITWKSGTSNLLFDRGTLSFNYTGTQNIKFDTAVNQTISQFTTSLGFDLMNFNITSPKVYETTNGEIAFFNRYLDYLALDTATMPKFIEDNKPATKAEIIEIRNDNQQLYVEGKSISDFKANQITKMGYMPLTIDTKPESIGVYPITTVDMAFQEINTYKVQSEQTGEESVISGSFIDIKITNKSNYDNFININQVSSFLIDAKKTSIGYIVNESNSIAYLHPIYVFTGEGTTNTGDNYLFYIYIDALPKSENLI